ncbi:MAG: hypothetical protein EPO08_04440 [Rhodospirillaceae bacterium]|nr:MAG: hypothetical protein EPO08_04440 [Rhodospirillaceae bacterium]
MTDPADTPEWLRYFIKRPIQGLFAVTASILLFVALIMFVNDVREIQESHISIEDGGAIIRCISNALLMIGPTAIIFFFVGLFYARDHGGGGPYLAGSLIIVGLVLLMIAAGESDPGVKTIFSNAGFMAFSAGFGFFAGVQFEKVRRPDYESDDALPPDSGDQIGVRRNVQRGMRRKASAGKH